MGTGIHVSAFIFIYGRKGRRVIATGEPSLQANVKTGLPRKKNERIPKTITPRDLAMGTTGNPLNKELLPVLPPLLAKKAAKDFTAPERGKVKDTFYMRSFLWNQVSKMVDSGMTAQRACDRIYEVYGQAESVTNILKALKKDKKERGVHPQLRILNR